LQYYDVSAKSNYQCEKPFLWLLKKLTGNPNLYLVEQLNLVDPEITIESSTINQIK
jgi:GTP-binding nuclear protein Ran